MVSRYKFINIVYSIHNKVFGPLILIADDLQDELDELIAAVHNKAYINVDHNNIADYR